MAGRHESFNRIIGAGIGVHVTVAAFQSCVRMCAVGEGAAHFLVAGGAQCGHRVSFGRLRVRIVASLALYPLLGMHRRSPFIRCSFVACAAQVCVRSDGHRLLGMVGLERAMAGFARHACFCVFPRLGIKAGSMALEAGNLATQLCPVTLKNGCGKCLGVPGILPF